jgi:serine/threonine-protein kinase
MTVTIRPGDLIAGKYRVERVLGSGGMGYVVAARHLALDQVVAIKFLHRHALSDDSALRRFRQEATACARLRGEHVAFVHDVGVHDEEPYIVMEYLEGVNLRHMTGGGQRLPIAQSCDYVIQACEALAEAHSLGIVHRDVTLANLFLSQTPGGDPLLKVLDFGVSKNLASELSAGDVSQTSACVGSPQHMSPEQLTDPRTVDARTDIWSLGVCLYRLLGGRAPFDGETFAGLCSQVLREPTPSLSALRPDLPTELERVIECCLEKDRDLRFANVAEVVAALAPFASKPERAAKVIERVSVVLGVAPPAPGYLPPARIDRGETAWARSSPPRPPFRRPSDLHLLYGALGLLVLIVGTMIASQPTPSLTRVAFGASSSAPGVVPQPPEPAPVVSAQVATPAPPVPTVLAPPAATTTPRRRTRRPSTIPADRK